MTKAKKTVARCPKCKERFSEHADAHEHAVSMGHYGNYRIRR